MSTYTGTPVDPVREFIDWRYSARENYESITMYVLPNHTVSLNFTQETNTADDSYIFGLILGDTKKDSNSEISLYNTVFPNKHSMTFNKSRPNKKWGEVSQLNSFEISGSLIAADVNTRNDIIAAYKNEVIYISENEETKHVFDDDQVTLIKCSPENCSTASFLCTAVNSILYYEAPGTIPMAVHEFTRPVIDLSIDPFQPKTALVTQGKTHIHLIDQREKSAVSLKMQNLTSSIAFSPHIPFIFANGLLSGDIGIFDLRSPQAPISNIQAHDSEVTSLKWSPFRKDVIASASLDTSITLWSLPSVKKNGAEAVFVHNGHVSPISVFDWCKDVPWTIASVSEDNLLEIWTVAPSQYEQ
ncbi:hypothetical protein TRFO_27959 [Tritrichomonas foetus]|uniref:Uncharacterized protein n=1 Tax=Tritrichomonas foetus TaxID=1144522 RepID=A0A1J4JZD4_9EUKA|nr:hypothetical protein TRFO_27959 [Tritrichomonas foetus]|eukprot:OHT04521.1 hypothetical protein TRFO_27959 [Tritrichomonas foetus]